MRDDPCDQSRLTLDLQMTWSGREKQNVVVTQSLCWDRSLRSLPDYDDEYSQHDGTNHGQNAHFLTGLLL